MRQLWLFLLAASSVAACSDLECLENEIKVGNVCRRLTKTADAGDQEPVGEREDCSDGGVCGQPHLDASSTVDAQAPNEVDRARPDSSSTCTPTLEVCDGQDNECDGVVDQGAVNECGMPCGDGDP